MTTLREVFINTLEADTALMALLTGGVTDAADSDIDGGGAADAPRAADGVTLLPHAKVRWRTANTLPVPRQLGALRQTVEVYLYQDRGYDVIDAAALRLRDLLHDQYLTGASTKLNHVLFVTASGEIPAPEYLDKPSRFVRFSITYV